MGHVASEKVVSARYATVSKARAPHPAAEWRAPDADTVCQADHHGHRGMPTSPGQMEQRNHFATRLSAAWSVAGIVARHGGAALFVAIAIPLALAYTASLSVSASACSVQ